MNNYPTIKHEDVKVLGRVVSIASDNKVAAAEQVFDEEFKYNDLSSYVVNNDLLSQKGLDQYTINRIFGKKLKSLDSTSLASVWNVINGTDKNNEIWNAITYLQNCCTEVQAKLNGGGGTDEPTEIHATGISVDAIAMNINDDPKLIAYRIAPTNSTDTVRFSINNPSIAEVTSDGKHVRAVSVGTATITATTSNGKTATASISVTDGQTPVATQHAVNWACRGGRCWIDGNAAGHDTVNDGATWSKTLTFNCPRVILNVMFDKETGYETIIEDLEITQSPYTISVPNVTDTLSVVVYPQYNITWSGEHAKINNATSGKITREHGTPIDLDIIPDDNYTMESVTVTVGGVSKPNYVYNNNRVLIPSVTDDVVISWSATNNNSGDESKTHRINWAFSGYGHDGWAKINNEVASANDVADGDTWIGSLTFGDLTEYESILVGAKVHTGRFVDGEEVLEPLWESDKEYTISPANIVIPNVHNNISIWYIIQNNDPYDGVTYNVTWSGEHGKVKSTASGSELVTGNTTFYALITPDSDYEFSSVTITMGGVDISNSARNGNEINIAHVTGDVIISWTTTYIGGGSEPDPTVDPILTVEDISVEKGSTAQVVWNILNNNNNDAPVSYYIPNHAVATVSNDGVVTGVGAGYTTVKVTTREGLEYTARITVTKPSEPEPQEILVESVTASPKTINLKVGYNVTTAEKTAIAQATVSPSNATDTRVVWGSSNDSIATVGESTGIITAIAAGTCTITAYAANGKNDSITVNVQYISEPAVQKLAGYVTYNGQSDYTIYNTNGGIYEAFNNGENTPTFPTGSGTVMVSKRWHYVGEDGWSNWDDWVAWPSTNNESERRKVQIWEGYNGINPDIENRHLNALGHLPETVFEFRAKALESENYTESSPVTICTITLARSGSYYVGWTGEGYTMNQTAEKVTTNAANGYNYKTDASQGWEGTVVADQGYEIVSVSAKVGDQSIAVSNDFKITAPTPLTGDVIVVVTTNLVSKIVYTSNVPKSGLSLYAGDSIDLKDYFTPTPTDMTVTWKSGFAPNSDADYKIEGSVITRGTNLTTIGAELHVSIPENSKVEAYEGNVTINFP